MKQTGKFILLYGVCIFTIRCLAQQPESAKNSVYGEFLGAGDLYSVNYERMFKPYHSLRIGLGVFPENWYEGGLHEKKIMNIPLSYQYLFGRSAHHIEASAGLISSFTFSTNQPTHYLMYPDIATGYRYQRDKRGLYLSFRVYLILPWNISIDKDDVLLYAGKSYYLQPGLSAGWSF